MSDEERDFTRETNIEAKQIILGNIKILADEVRANAGWDQNQISDFLRRYDLLLIDIHEYIGKTKAHQENDRLVYFDFDTKDLLIINNFIKKVIIPIQERKMQNPRLLTNEKRESIENLLNYLNGMVMQGDIIVKGSSKQNA